MALKERVALAVDDLRKAFTASEVAVREDGADHADRPLAPAKILCGNRIVVPGAFELTGGKPHRVCVRIEDQADACLTLAPE